MPKGKKAKHKGRNITGLRNQKNQPLEEGEPPLKKARLGDDKAGPEADSDTELGDLAADSEMMTFASTHGDLDEVDWMRHDGIGLAAEDDMSEPVEWEDCDEEDWNGEMPFEERMKSMARLSAKLGDDPRDEDWLPPKVRADLCRRQWRTQQLGTKLISLSF